MSEPTDKAARQIELVISNLLRFGVIASLLIILSGITVTFVKHPEYRDSHTSLQSLTGDHANFPKSLTAAIGDLPTAPGRSLVVLGLLLLVATPVMRVAVSVIAFIYERDWPFVIITAVVLALLLTSFAIGRATGG